LSTTSTTTPPTVPGTAGDSGSSTTTAPSSTPSSSPPSTADVSQDGDNGSPVGGGPGQVIPPDAQAILDTIVRTAPNDNHLLVAGERALLAAGVDPDQAARLAYGSFPVAGPAHWADDWWAPRWTGTTFRFHLGLDIIADYGTPLRSPADGLIGIQNDPLGGLAVKVILPDNTFFYLAHLSATAPGLTQGQPIKQGDLIGYVGQSGDATGPHCHFGIYQAGTTAIPPKPLVDLWVSNQAEQLPGIIASATGGTGATPRPLLATGLVRQLADDTVRAAESPGGAARSDLLFATSANPLGGALQVAQATAAQAADGVDWARRATLTEAYQRAWDQAVLRAWVVLTPLTPPALRP
jgi:murein DD-endopeptidase MepM/ murein hydrolase activator NlpD